MAEKCCCEYTQFQKRSFKIRLCQNVLLVVVGLLCGDWAGMQEEGDGELLLCCEAAAWLNLFCWAPSREWREEVEDVFLEFDG